MLNRANLEIAKLAATEESRYTLTGILVTPNETVETDGHQLIRVSTPKTTVESWPLPENEPTPLDNFDRFILPKQAALDAVKAIPRARGTLPICKLVAVGADTAVNGTATLITNDLDRVNRIQAKKMDGQFPDWTRVIPDKAKADYVTAFSAKQLADVLSAAVAFDKANDNGRAAVVTLRFTAPDEALRIDIASGDQEFTGVVMPYSNDDAKAFVESRKQAKEQAQADADCLATLRRDKELRRENNAESEPADDLPHYQMIDTDREEHAERFRIGLGAVAVPDAEPEPAPKPEAETVEPEPEPEPVVDPLADWLA